MNLKTKYFIFISFIHVFLSVILFILFKENKLYFLISELFILISIYISIKLYQAFIYPINLMKSGKNAIQDKDFSIKYNLTGATDVDQLIDIYNKMIEELRQEKTKTQEQSYFLENLIQYSPIGMIIMDYDFRIDIINDAAKSILGKNAEKGKSLKEIKHVLSDHISDLKPSEDKVFNVASRQKFKCRKQELIHKGFPRQFILIEELTEEILLAEKRAFGKVIRMMAHEVNNSMGAINSILESVKEFGFSHEDADSDLIYSLDIAIERNKGLASFTDHFADLIRLPSPVIANLNLSALINDIAHLYRIKAKKYNIHIHYQADMEDIWIKADKIQREQAFGNILKNAVESISENGDIWIKLDHETKLLQFIDNGPGISKSDSEKLFSPFFSTKTNGQGIGLMLIREILTSHGFEFDLYTDATDGLTFFNINFSTLNTI